MYCISLIDRSNLGLAMIAGMSKDLGLAKGNRYSIVVLLFFVSYMCVIVVPQPSLYLVHPNPENETDTQASQNLIDRVKKKYIRNPFEPNPSPRRTRKLANLPRRGLRRRHAGHGLRQELGRAGTVPVPARHPRGRLPARLRISDQLLVHALRGREAPGGFCHDLDRRGRVCQRLFVCAFAAGGQGWAQRVEL